MNVPRIARIIPNSPQNPRSSGFYYAERREKMAYGKGMSYGKKGGSMSKKGGMSYAKKGNTTLSPQEKPKKAKCGPHTPR